MLSRINLAYKALKYNTWFTQFYLPPNMSHSYNFVEKGRLQKFKRNEKCDSTGNLHHSNSAASRFENEGIK